MIKKNLSSFILVSHSIQELELETEVGVAKMIVVEAVKLCEDKVIM